MAAISAATAVFVLSFKRRDSSVGAFFEKMQVLHDAIEIPANVIQMPDGGDGFHGLLERLQGIAAVGTGVRHIARHRGSSRQDHIVSKRDMRSHDGIAAGDELPADLRRASHHEAGREKAVLAQVADVRNMTNIVQFGDGTDVGGCQRGAVDGAIAADFDTVADSALTLPRCGIFRGLPSGSTA